MPLTQSYVGVDAVTIFSMYIVCLSMRTVTVTVPAVDAVTIFSFCIVV